MFGWLIRAIILRVGLFSGLDAENMKEAKKKT
jgi:hypothetical protein